MSRSTILHRLLRRRFVPTSAKIPTHPFVSTPPNLSITSQTTRHYRSSTENLSRNALLRMAENTIDEIRMKLDRERKLERDRRIKEGISVADLDAEEEEDYMGVGPLIEKYEKQDKKDNPSLLNQHEEPSDSESEDEYEQARNQRAEMLEKKLAKHAELLKKFSKAATLDDAFKLMKQIDKFEEKQFPFRLEYQVIRELMNRLKVAEGKEKFLLQMKLNRAFKLLEWKEAFNPKDPVNYGLLDQDKFSQPADHEEDDEEEDKEGEGSDDELKLGDTEEDSEFLEKINEIDKKLEHKLAELEYTFGKKGKLLEEEIRVLAEERNILTEQKRQPLFRKGFDVRLVDLNRTCKVTKGGQVVKYTALLACGNYNGLIGFATAKAPTVPIAMQKARAKCFQNLHYIERHENHTIAHAVQTSYKKTKIYLWPAPTRTGMKAGGPVQTILSLAGFKNLKSKVIGSRNAHNTVKAVFKALNAVETPRDVEEKFGRTVVESYLL